jgi:hypothetical protein
MDTVLLAVTILSLAMALALAFIVTRLIREERARSEARVSALSAMAVQTVPGPPPVAAPGPRVVSAPRMVATPKLDDLDLRPAPETVRGVSQLFEEAAAPSPWGRRFAVIGVLAAIVLAVAVALASVHAGVTASPAATSAAAQPAVVDGAPLELVTLKHRQETDRLVISGLVQNPRSGRPISHVVATAFLFGPDGGFLTSSRAPLDFTTLSPGDESAFVINVPVTGQIARYRIGFRTEDGRVIEHVDKRAPDALAQK